IARATGRLQRTGVSSRSTSVIPGPNDDTMSSMPYGPPLTLKKKMAAIGTSPSSRLRPPVRSRPPSRGDELRELLHPFLDRPRGVHDDLELAAREPAHPARRRGAQRDDQHLPVNAEGVRHHEDRVDLLQGNDLKHRDLPGADRLSRPCPTPGTETSGSASRPASSARRTVQRNFIERYRGPRRARREPRLAPVEEAPPMPAPRFVGSEVKRLEDPRLIRGQAQYLDDLVLAGMVYGWVIRSPHAHARVVRIDASRARKHPGVHAVFTARDLPGALRPKPPILIPPNAK